MNQGANEIVPFLAVRNLRDTVAFYVQGLGFEMIGDWEEEGVLRWCKLRLGKAAFMFQQFKTEGPDAKTFGPGKGDGVIFCIFCDDVIPLYAGFVENGIKASVPQVGNGLWATTLMDPDGYRLDFESPTDEPEDTKWSAGKPGERK